jgi:hypothetical protein
LGARNQALIEDFTHHLAININAISPRDQFALVDNITLNSDLAAFSTSWFRRRFAPPKPAFTVRALRARTVNAKGARSRSQHLSPW